MDFLHDNRPLAAVIGMFDGVHRGHRFLIDRLRAEASLRGLRPAVFTFPSHPLQLITPLKAPRLLTPPEEKLTLLTDAGIEPSAIFFLTFTPEMRSATASGFMEKLHNIYNVRFILRGFNNRFGTERDLSAEDYRTIAAHKGIELIDATDFKVEINGRQLAVCSSEVRRLLSAGNICTANRLSGHAYSLTGTVIGGQQLGRRLGFPTANIHIPHQSKLIPANGVYVATTTLSCGDTHRVMINIGTRPTVASGGAPATIEAHILDFNGNLYGSTITLYLHKRLRSEQRFPSLDALAARLALDADIARSMPLEYTAIR